MLDVLESLVISHHCLKNNWHDKPTSPASPWCDRLVSNQSAVPLPRPLPLKIAVLNMERGKNWREVAAFIQNHPDLTSVDILLANELDWGCARTGQKDITYCLAQKLGMAYCYGLEFLERTDPKDTKGYHGNAIFSRYPILQAGLIQLPNVYDWALDEQRRSGNRTAIWAEIEVFTGTHEKIGVVCTHLENRTDPQGRFQQFEALLEALPSHWNADFPMVIGGDLNTNCVHGQDKSIFEKFWDDMEFRRSLRCDVFAREPLLDFADKKGWHLHHLVDGTTYTRRKPLKGVFEGQIAYLYLDWLLSKNMQFSEVKIISTACSEIGQAIAANSRTLAAFVRSEKELTDHNAVVVDFFVN